MIRKSFAFCACLIVLVIFAQESDALKKGDVGTCDGKVSSIGKRQVSYWITGRCKNAPRKICRARRWKIITYIKWTSGTICCEGYQHDSELDACKPICSTGCLYGVCAAPETCTCSPPFYLDPVRKNICRLPPACDPPCVNAYCEYKQTASSYEQSDDGFCECLNNTRRYNDTHCAFCQEGFMINKDLTCTPVCKNLCNNGQCKSPDKCECFDGYHPLDDFNCQPHCDVCVNSDCIEPGKCKCRPDFTAVNATYCERCECENGKCVDGQCVCNSGYVLEDGVCEAVCDPPCVNSLCVTPGVCLCYEGHSKLTSNGSNVCCRPECGSDCNGGGECPSVACVLRKRVVIPDCTPTPKNRCVKIEVINGASCCKGWLYNEHNDTCEPFCLTECVNGQCIAPNTCECLRGYMLQNETCVPQCNPPCNNGVCSAPNECTCDTNYQLDPTDKFNCQPICEPQCVYASCVSPNTCSCYHGYESRPENSWQCKPVCDSCQNGECTGPNNCTCNAGYEKKGGKCAPICEEPCLNGYCSDPNVCSCHMGYELNAVNKFVCEPICEPTCQNAKCISPNRCVCHWGYEFENDTMCRPICHGCENGKCVAPNDCSCDKGYTMKDGQCTPECDFPCVHGFCSEPNVCTCDKGYTYNILSFTCEPICEPACKNAECVSPNICTCLLGYEFENLSTCRPVCHSCENGNCVAPNNCSCNRGYTIKDGKCTPDCDLPCVHGYCSEPNVCTCDKNYTYNPLNFSCEPVCDPPCENSRCISPNLCFCEQGFEQESNWKCKPKCDGCVNGNCIAPNACSCNKGYSFDNVTSTCVPVCNTPCQNGTCIKPNKCKCDSGFKQYGETSSCMPVCDPECINSKCTAPNHCSCYDGYEKQAKSSDNICKPVCKSCEHGVCNAPDTCECNEGYNMRDGKCSPVCSDGCSNAICSSPNVCTCLEGYIKKEGRDNVCRKKCDGPCDNGYCNDYGMCECHKGFEMQNFTCQPIEQVDCESCEGNCTSEVCSCMDGSPCYLSSKATSEEITTSTSLAGLEWSWMLGGAVGVLLLTLLLVTIQRTYARRKREEKAAHNQKGSGVGSVVNEVVVPDALIMNSLREEEIREEDYDTDTSRDPYTEVQDSLMGTKVDIEDEHL